VGDVSSPRQSLVDFTARGGRVLVLRQEAYPEGLLDVSLTSQQSTMTIPQAVHHPALAGLEAEDFKFWRGDHRVTSAEVARPTAGAVPLVVSGSAAGIDTTPLVARPIGQGCMVFCQMLLTEKYDREPAAARLLSNLLAWLDGYRAVTGQTAVYGPPEYKALLASLGLRFDEVGDWSSQWRAAPPRLVICRGAAPDAAPLRKFVEQGGHLWLHRLPLERLGPLAAALGAPLEARPYAGPVTRVEDDAPLLDHVTREDLYWLGRHEGIGWAETPRVATMADGVFCKSLSGKSVASYEVEDWELEGGIVERQAPGVAFATVGVARQTIKFPATGQYLIGVHARGTPTAGVFPLVRIAVDGQIAGVVSAGDAWQTTTVAARIDQGLHELSVAFINDASNPPLEDRNLFVDRVLVAPDDGRDRVAFLTTPAALAVSRCGQGLVVWDQIAWDTEESNARKATRLAGSLLTALGAEFAPRVGTMIEAERMTPQPGVPHFSNAGGFASMACNGYIASPFRVAQAGRYRLEVIASGSAAANVYPEVEVLVDGRSAGTIRLSSPGWRSYALPLDLSLGDHQLRLAFINDFNRGGEDRNLRLDRVTFYRE
jgi:hypothetical protein